MRVAQRPRASESQEQIALFDWRDRVGARRWPVLWWMFHVPNGGARHPAVAARLKAEGVTPGVEDIFLDHQAHGYAGLRIELKAEGGKPTEAQKGWIDYHNSAGYYACVCVGWNRAREVIEWYLEEK